MNNDDKILKILADLQSGQKALHQNMTAVKNDLMTVKAETNNIPGIEQQLEQQGKLIGAMGDNVATLLSDHSAQRQNIRALQTDIGTLHEEFHTSHEELKGEIRAARAEAKMDNIDLKSTVAKKIQSHERRITNVEEHEGIENPEKH